MLGIKLQGRYLIEERLGGGNQGEVYRATDGRLRRTVAIKVMKAVVNPDQPADDAERGFRREAQITAMFDHAHVVKVYEFDVTATGVPFFVMEYVRGQTLEAITPRLTPAEIGLFARQVCSALHHAHARGLVHRDLKPGNLMLVDRGRSQQQFMILDLGIAKLLGSASLQSASLTKLTFTGAGTPLYMSPEQIRGETVDLRSDIYSLGTILFELLTHKNPFAAQSKSLAHLLYAVDREDPLRLAEAAPNFKFSRLLEELIADCLAKDPARRPGSMQELLRRFLKAHLVPKPDRAEIKQRTAETAPRGRASRNPRQSWEALLKTQASAIVPADALQLERSDSAPLPVIGIDLGTTSSAVAYLNAAGQPGTIPNSEGQLLTPSVVWFDKTQVLVGRAALQAAMQEPGQLADFAKQEMGNTYYSTKILGRQVPPEVIQSLILNRLKRDAERRLGLIHQAVITVPAAFDEPSRKATQDAGRLAGLKSLDLINEPTAAALAYGCQVGFLNPRGESTQTERILVYDLGGGTFDVSVLEIAGTAYTLLATEGDVGLGGIDWDRRIADQVAQEFQRSSSGADPRLDPADFRRLLLAAEEAKRALSERDETTISFLGAGQGLRLTYTRAQFEMDTADLLERTRIAVRSVLHDARLKWQDITRLLLVGGASRMPMVQALLEREAGPGLNLSIAADEAVALGAAIYAGIVFAAKSGTVPALQIRSVNAYALGVLAREYGTEQARNSIMIPRNTSLPCTKLKYFRTAYAGQRSLGFKLIEGGDTTGQNSTPIGNCTIRNLSPDLPEGSRIEVRFTYSANGRLTVTCRLPDSHQETPLAIERATGLTDSQLVEWLRRLRNATGVLDLTE